MTTQAAERKLAAIMFTDMVGFSALIERNASAASDRRIEVRIGLHLGDPRFKALLEKVGLGE